MKTLSDIPPKKLVAPQFILYPLLEGAKLQYYYIFSHFFQLWQSKIENLSMLLWLRFLNRKLRPPVWFGVKKASSTRKLDFENFFGLLLFTVTFFLYIFPFSERQLFIGNPLSVSVDKINIWKLGNRLKNVSFFTNESQTRQTMPCIDIGHIMSGKSERKWLQG